jgi:hypothetical protein
MLTLRWLLSPAQQVERVFAEMKLSTLRSIKIKYLSGTAWSVCNIFLKQQKQSKDTNFVYGYPYATRI